MIKRLISLALAGAFSLGLMTASPASQGSGCMPTTGTVSGLSFAQLINSAIAALISSNSGASAPATDCTVVSVKGQIWLDTSITPNILKQYDGTQWSVLGALDASNRLWAPPIGGGTATIASAATTDIWANPASSITINGASTVTALANANAVPGTVKVVTASGAFTLTHNAASLILPSAANITVAAGDRFLVSALNSTNVAVFAYTKADGTAITNPAVPVGTILDYGGDTAPAGFVMANGVCLSSTTYPALSIVYGSKYGTCSAGQFAIPDGRARAFVGVDDMGAGSSGRLNSVAPISGGATTVGSLYGAALKTLSNGDLPVTNLTFTGTNGSVSVTSTATVPQDAATKNFGLNDTAAYAPGAGQNFMTSNGSFTPAGTINSFGGGGSFPLLQPTILVSKIIKY